MIILRMLGYLFLLAAIACGGAEIYQSLEAGYWDIVQVGDIWSMIDQNSLRQTQVGLERYVHPFLWDPILLNIVLAPAWLVLGIIALILLAIGRRRRTPRMFA